MWPLIFLVALETGIGGCIFLLERRDSVVAIDVSDIEFTTRDCEL